MEGFTGMESILYHLQSPCRVKEFGAFEPIEREEWVPDAHAHRHFKTAGVAGRGRPDHRPAAPDVEQRRRDLALPPERAHGGLLPERRGRRGASSSTRARERSRRSSATCRTRTATTSSSRAARPTGSCRRRTSSATSSSSRPGLIEIPRRYRNQYGQLLEGAPYYHRDIHPPARAEHAPRPRRLRGQGARPRRLPDLRHRLPPVRRRRLGRLPLPVDVLDPRLRADHRPDPPAAALAPDLPGAELRDLLVLPAQARLRPAGGADPVPPLESPVARR